MTTTLTVENARWLALEAVPRLAEAAHATPLISSPRSSDMPSARRDPAYKNVGSAALAVALDIHSEARRLHALMRAALGLPTRNLGTSNETTSTALLELARACEVHKWLAVGASTRIAAMTASARKVLASTLGEEVDESSAVAAPRSVGPCPTCDRRELYLEVGWLTKPIEDVKVICTACFHSELLAGRLPAGVQIPDELILVTAADAARRLGVSVDTVSRRIARRAVAQRGTTVVHGRSRPLYDLTDLMGPADRVHAA